MKLFSKVRTLLATALCATIVASGAAAVTSLTNQKTQNVNATEVTVSSDIQNIINDFETGFSKKEYVTVKYVSNYAMANGGTASGILLTVNCPTTSGDVGSTGYYDSGNWMLPTVYDITKMTGNTNPFAGVILSPNYVAASKDDRYVDQIQIGMHNVGSTQGFTYVIGYDSDNKDAVSAPKSKVDVRVFGAGGWADYKTAGIYYPNSPAYSYGVRGISKVSVLGYASTPFNMYYDYNTNVSYKDKSGANYHQTDYSRLGHFLNVDPKQLASIPFNKQYCDYANMPNLANYTGSNASKLMPGFANGEANFDLRVIVKAGTDATILFTNFMGLDLSNPLNSFTTEVLKTDDVGLIVNTDYAIKAPRYESPIGTEKATTFDGVVNVYKGARNYTYAYGSYGSTVANIQAELGAPIYTGKKVGDVLNLTEKGNYTVEYVATNGSVAYATLNVSDGLEITALENVNAKAYVNGAELKVGDKLVAGDVLKFEANEGCNLYNYTSGDSGAEAVLLNGAKVTLNGDNEYVVTADDAAKGTATIDVVAYTKKFSVTLARYGGGSNAVLTMFEGVSTKYFIFDANMWKTATVANKTVKAYYNLFAYDGANGYILNGGVPTNDKYVVPANADKPAFKITRDSDGSTVGLYKNGAAAANAIPLNESVTISVVEVRTDVTSSIIKTEGTVGLTVEYLVDKASYDLMKEAYDAKKAADPTKTLEYKITAIVIPAKHIKAFNDLMEVGNPNDVGKDPYRYYDYANRAAYKEALKGKWATVEITEFGEDKVVDGVTYKCFNVTIRNIKLANYAEGFYVGAYFDLGTLNGGQILRLGLKTGNSFKAYNVLESAKLGYAAITNEASETATKVTINEVDYYSETLNENQITTLVKFYNYGMFLKSVKDVETEGYASVEVGGLTYWYDTSAITNQADAIRIINYATNVIATSI